MFTARSFLEAPPGLEKRLGLPKELSAHPERLRREFLEIAINSSEHFLLRQGALSTIWLHADEMNARSSREFVDALLGAFVREFTPAKLESICSLTREIEHNGEA